MWVQKVSLKVCKFRLKIQFDQQKFKNTKVLEDLNILINFDS